mgnify:CR=1 FL=1
MRELCCTLLFSYRSCVFKLRVVPFSDDVSLTVVQTMCLSHHNLSNHQFYMYLSLSASQPTHTTLKQFIRPKWFDAEAFTAE